MKQKNIFLYFNFCLIILIIFTLSIPNISHASHRLSSTLRTKINNLDNDRVDELSVAVVFGVTPLNIYPSFGAPRSGGRTHEGIDIMAPKGALIASPTDAVVTRIDRGDSAGIYVYTANPGGESMAYMHLSDVADIERGDVLKRGDLIGYVGNTGNAITTNPHLHYELHDDAGDPIDPYPRITRIFTIYEKISALAQAVKEKDDPEFVRFIISVYKGELLLAKSFGVTLPPEVEAELSLAIQSTYWLKLVNAPYMTVGSWGASVAALQNYLISKNVGTGGSLIPDGSFGPKTKQALIEYQHLSGVLLADGTFNSETKAYVLAHP